MTGRDEVDGPLAELLAKARRQRAELDGTTAELVEALVGQGDFCGAVRAAVGIGGCSQAEVADALSVMPSSVRRYLNRETGPQGVQVPIYARRLLDHLRNRPPYDPLDVPVLVED